MLKFIKASWYFVSSLIAGFLPTKIKQGQIWKYEPLSNADPFRENKIVILFEIIEVRNGFVKYKDLKNGLIESDRITYFKTGCKFIK